MKQIKYQLATPILLFICLFTYGLVLAAQTEYGVHYSVNSHAKDDMCVKAKTINILMNLLNMSIIN